MLKIFGYECRRLLWNKFFWGLLSVLLFYGWQVLSRVTILGVSHTAPFSPWSFGDYLSRMLPLLWIGLLFFLRFFHSGRARRVEVLTDATPVPARRYAWTRCAAALAGTGLLILVCLAEACLFYARYFGWYRWGTLLFPALIALVPPILFGLGSGWILGKKGPGLLDAWMLFPLICVALPLPEALGLWNGTFFTRYPLTLEGLDPQFAVPAAVMLVQSLFSGAGLLLLALLAGRGQSPIKQTNRQPLSAQTDR